MPFSLFRRRENMEELKQKITDLINEYFDKKIENVEWRYDMSAEERVKNVIAECTKEVAEELEGYDKDVDTELELFEEYYKDEASAYWEDLRLDNGFRERELIEEWRRL